VCAMAYKMLCKSVQTRARPGDYFYQVSSSIRSPRSVRASVPCEIRLFSSRGVVMAKSLTRLQVNHSLEMPNSDGDGNHINNLILLSLPASERKIVFDNLEFVRLIPQQVLHETGDTLKSGYFCDTGMISILSVFSDGKSVEVGLVGKEGFLGLPLIAGFRTAATRATVQIDGTAFRVDADKLTMLLRQCPTLAQKLQQFSQVMTMELPQIAACNRLHEVEERL